MVKKAYSGNNKRRLKRQKDIKRQRHTKRKRNPSRTGNKKNGKTGRNWELDISSTNLSKKAKAREDNLRENNAKNSKEAVIYIMKIVIDNKPLK